MKSLVFRKKLKSTINMTKSYLSVLCIILFFIGKTKFPIVPVVDVDTFVIEDKNLKCDKGCDLVETKIEKLLCDKNVADYHIENNVEQTKIVRVGDNSYGCRPNIKIPADIRLVIETFECNFSDETNLLMITDSCTASYSYEKIKPGMATKIYDAFIGCTLSLILIILLFLAGKEYLNQVNDEIEVVWDPPTVTDPVPDTKIEASKEGFDTRNIREEKRFVQEHSMLKERRGRSRSRRRLI